MADTKGFSKISDLLTKYDKEEDKYISREFQKYGYDLATELGDSRHISLYIKLAKTQNRGIMETARNFVKDAPNVKNKAALFLWKLKQLNKNKKS